jgi:hypothetical protein
MSILIAPLMAAMAFSSPAAAVESDNYTFEHQVSVSAHYLQYDDTGELDMPVLSGGYGYQITTPDKKLSFTPEIRVGVGRTSYYGDDVTLSSFQAAVRMTANVNESLGLFIRPNYTLSKYKFDGGSTPSDTEFGIAYGASIKLNKTLNLDFSIEHFEDSKAYGIGVRIPM